MRSPLIIQLSPIKRCTAAKFGAQSSRPTCANTYPRRAVGQGVYTSRWSRSAFPDHGDVEESGGGRSGAESYVECSRLTWLYGDVIEPTNCLYLTTLHQVIQSLACLLAFNLGRNT